MERQTRIWDWILFLNLKSEVLAGTALAIAGWRCEQYDGIVALGACEHFERGQG